MTARLAEVGARIEGVRQLGAVVNAMRGIAAARARQARTELAAVDSYSAIIAAAIGRALALVDGGPHAAEPPPGKAATVVFLAEQGFAGAFSERILDHAASGQPASAMFLVGTKGIAVAAERGLTPAWSCAMPSRSSVIPALANRVAEALYAGIATGRLDRLDVVFGDRGAAPRRRILLPFDAEAFRKPASGPVRASAPLTNLPHAALLEALVADFVHAQLCEAALHAFAAENEARMEAMSAAGSQIDRQLDTLRATQRIVRQEEITAEIIELAAGEQASV